MRFPLDMNFKTLAPHMYFKEVKDDEKNNMMEGRDNGVLDSILIMSYNSYDTIQDPIEKKTKSQVDGQQLDEESNGSAGDPKIE